MINTEEHILDVSLYPNELGLIKFNSEEAIKQLSGFEMAFPKDKDPITEDYLEFPSFARHFWITARDENNIPKQQEFREGYLRENGQHVNIKSLTPYLMKCFEARLHRAYPSFVRDLVLSLQLSENSFLKEHGIDVSYNIELDLKGLDILLTYKDEMYGLDCYVGTKNAKNRKEQKQERHPDFNNVYYVDMKLRTHIAVGVGENKLHLYDDFALEVVKHNLEIS
jgi:hypothetical protein